MKSKLQKATLIIDMVLNHSSDKKHEKTIDDVKIADIEFALRLIRIRAMEEAKENR
jgi:hypothetical protein